MLIPEVGVCLFGTTHKERPPYHYPSQPLRSITSPIKINTFLPANLQPSGW